VFHGLLMPEHLLILVVFPLLVILPFWQIWKKAGYTPLLSLLMPIVPLGLVLIYVLAFARWKGQPAIVASDTSRFTRVPIDGILVVSALVAGAAGFLIGRQMPVHQYVPLNGDVLVDTATGQKCWAGPFPADVPKGWKDDTGTPICGQ
jgi:hypothetical protein